MFKSLLLISFLAISYQIFDEAHNVVKLQNEQKLMQIMQGTDDFLSMFIFWHEDSPNCNKQLADFFQKFAYNKNGMIKVYQLDCDYWEGTKTQQMQICQKENINHLPAVLFIKPNEQPGQPPLQEPFQGQLSQRELGNHAKKLLNTYSIQLENLSDYDEFIQDKDFENKVILFKKEKETGWMWAGLTTEFRDRIDFADTMNIDIVKKHKINTQELPQLIVIKYNHETKEQEVKLFESKFRLDNLQEFLKPYAKESKVQRQTVKKQKQKSQQSSSKDEKKKPKEEEKVLIKTLRSKFYDKNILSKEGFQALHIYNKQGNYTQYDELTKKFDTMMEYYQIDQEQEKEFVKDTLKLNENQIPCVIIYLSHHDKSKKVSSKLVFSNKNPVSEIITELNDVVDDPISSIQSEMTFQQNIGIAVKDKKHAIILLHKKTYPPFSYKVIANDQQYQKYATFNHYKNPSTQILQQFGLTDSALPRLVSVFGTDEMIEQNGQQQPKISVIAYPGQINYKGLKEFMDGIKAQITGETVNRSQNQINEVNTQEDLDNYCTKKRCVIAIFNGNNQQRQFDDDEPTQLQQQQKSYQAMANKYSIYNFIWVDGICHSEILYPFDLSEDYLPSLLTYNPQEKLYNKLLGRFSEQNLIEYGIKMRQNKNLAKTQLNDKLNIKEQDCVEVHTQLEKEAQEREKEQEDDVDKAFMEEIRLKQNVKDIEGDLLRCQDGKKGKKCRKTQNSLLKKAQKELEEFEQKNQNQDL